jgi:glucose uptake protein
MFIVDSYAVAVVMCFVTMLCWGSWANTQKLASKEWKFQLFYWDYAIGVLLFSLILAFTLGSFGSGGQSFLGNISQAAGKTMWVALIGGVVFNLSNILLVGAIDIAGLAVAFPIGVGLALVIGVITNYIASPVGNAVLLFAGVGGVTAAIIVDGLAYKQLPGQGRKTVTKGIVLSILAGVLMGFFYRFVAASMSTNFFTIEAGKFTPYSAIVFFSLGVLISNALWNSIVMAKPFTGEPVPYIDYFKKGNARLHLIGILGGMIWCAGLSFSIVASGQASFAISYGLGQGATMIAAFWGVFIWREFKGASANTNILLAIMFLLYIVGLTLIIVAKLI